MFFTPPLEKKKSHPLPLQQMLEGKKRSFTWSRTASPAFPIRHGLPKHAVVTDVLDLPADGRFVGRDHRFPLRVYFEDTDVAGIVYYANYLRFMERARSAMLRAVGIDQRSVLEAGGGVYAVADVAIRYRKPAKLDDALLVVSRVAQVRAASCVIHQQVMRGREILTDAQVTAAFVSAAGKPMRQPGEWVLKFRDLVDA